LELQTYYGWFDYGWGEDSDMVSMTILALQPYAERLPEVATSMELAREYLRNSQLSNGGFLSSPLWGSEANANSTAMAILAINALGEYSRDWNTFETYEGDGGDPIVALMRFAMGDGSFGADFGHGVEFNEMATRDAFLAFVAWDLGENVFTYLQNRELENWDLPYDDALPPAGRTGNNLLVWIITIFAVMFSAFALWFAIRQRANR